MSPVVTEEQFAPAAELTNQFSGKGMQFEHPEQVCGKGR